MKPKADKITRKLEYRLIGIVTDMSSHQVLWLMNTKFGLNFQTLHEVETRRKGCDISFPIYTCDYSRYLVYELYTNKVDGNFLVNSHKAVSYILQCLGTLSDEAFFEFIKDLKQQSNISTVFEIDQSELKKTELRLFEQ